MPPTLTDAQRSELERRADEDDAAPDDAVPWEVVKAQARAKLKPSVEPSQQNDS